MVPNRARNSLLNHLRRKHCHTKSPVCQPNLACNQCRTDVEKAMVANNPDLNTGGIKCPLCDKTWFETRPQRTRASLFAHLRSEHCESRAAKCKIDRPCDKCRTTAESALANYEWQYFPCFGCGKSFHTQSYQATHLTLYKSHRRRHLQELDNISITSLNAGMVPCFGCGSLYFSKPIRTHLIKSQECQPRMKMVSDARFEQQFKCLSCEQSLGSKLALMKHLADDGKCTEKHAQKLLRLPSDQMRMCFECGRIYEAAEFPRHLQECLSEACDADSSDPGEISSLIWEVYSCLIYTRFA